MPGPFPRPGVVASTLSQVLLVAALCAHAGAQPMPFLVEDLNAATQDAAPGRPTVSGGRLFFTVASDGIEGPFGGEIWSTDGTAARTGVVADIVPGPLGSGPALLTDADGTLFFAAGSLPQLWKTDGTAPGTVFLGGGFQPTEIASVGPRVFFAAFDVASCYELWTSDGTPGGTVLVADINPGCDCHFDEEYVVCTGHSQPQHLTDVDDTLFFVATDPVSGRELWKSDGTTAGTVLVKDINPGLAGSSPSLLTNADGTLFFVADDGTNGAELWSSDGTDAGTALVKDVLPGPDGSSPRALHAAGGVLYFRAREPATGHELWRSDGTGDGTTLVADVNPGPASSTPGSTSPPSDPIVDANGTLFFQANDGMHGAELWSSDGTGPGTSLVRDINPGSGSSDVFHLTAVGDRVFFRAFRPSTGTEVWISDGTAPGTELVKDVHPGPGFSNPGNFVAFAGRLFFTAFDPATGGELWRSDGTPAGTTLLRDINADTLGASLTELTGVGDVLFFHADDTAHGEELWRSDGTPAGTSLVKDIVPGPFGALADLVCGADCRHMADVDGLLLFTAFTPGGGIELWRSDGTDAGTSLVTDIDPSGSSRPGDFAVLDGVLYFSATAPGTGRELWRSDGTPAGTALVRDIMLGPASASPGGVAVANGALFFRADDGEHGSELWTSDGTAAGTRMVADVDPGPGDGTPFDITAAGGHIFFSAGDGATGREPWTSDGTAAGTVRLADIWPGPDGSAVRELTDVGGRLFFVASDPTNGDEVWTSDGTAAGTSLLRDINPGLGSGFGIFAPTGLTSFRGMLFFRAFQPATQNELWRSDGTPAGTVLVKDVFPGVIGSGPRDLTVLGDVLYFAAGDPTAGTELWKSDGSESGTVRVADIAPGVRASDPEAITRVEDRLFFTAATAQTGRELWGFAPCVAGGSCTGVCATVPCTTVLGRRIRVQGGGVRDQRVMVEARDTDAGGGIVGDPTTSGATLQLVASGASPSRQTVRLPAGSWRALGSTGFAYADRAGVNGPVSSVVIKRRARGAFTVKARLRGALGALAIRPPAPGTEAGLRLRIEGEGGWCVRFGGPSGGQVRNVGGEVFEIVAPTSEAGCP
jgi:ELWxxDGT repeat protein